MLRGSAAGRTPGVRCKVVALIERDAALVELTRKVDGCGVQQALVERARHRNRQPAVVRTHEHELTERIVAAKHAAAHASVRRLRERITLLNREVLLAVRLVVHARLLARPTAVPRVLPAASRNPTVTSSSPIAATTHAVASAATGAGLTVIKNTMPRTMRTRRRSEGSGKDALVGSSPAST